MTSFDVIVIGSGPAGCSAAVTCAKAGLQVLIVTEEAEPGEGVIPVPAPLESMHPGVSSLLEKIGLSGAERSATLAHYAGIYAGQTYAPLGEDANGAWQGMHIHRELFNAQLLHQVQESGISVRFNQKVDNFIQEDGRVTGITSGSSEYIASCFIDASGKKAIAGKKLNFKRKFFSPPLFCWTGVSRHVDAVPFDQRAAHFIPGIGGWTWLAFQPPDHCAWTRLSVISGKSVMPPDELRGSTTLSQVKVANMRWRMFRPLCSEGIVLCGDAAGILDPAAGQGIFNALWSGMVAGHTVIACIRDPDREAFHLAQYDDWFVQQFEMKVEQLRSYYQEHNINIFT